MTTKKFPGILPTPQQIREILIGRTHSFRHHSLQIKAHELPLPYLAMHRFFLLAVAVSAVIATPQTCSDRTTVVNSKWTLPLTNIASRQFCTFTFKIPQGTYAVLNIQAQNANDTDIYISDGLGSTIGKFGAATFSKNVALPANFEVNIQTRSTDALLIQADVTVHSANPNGKVAGRVTTDLNAPSNVVHFDQWEEGNSYIFTSKSTGRKIDLKVATVNDFDVAALESIFVYDGDSVVGTLLKVSNNQDFVSQSNQVTLFMAKKVTDKKGAVLVTDYSNVQNLNAHFVDYRSTGSDSMTYLLLGSNNKGAAVTVISGASISATGIRRLDNLNGVVSVLSGGPVVDHSKATVLSENSLPVALSGTVNTFYISKGEATISYK